MPFVRQVGSLIMTNRYHTVQEFNKGVYDYIIATDESGARGEHDFEDDAAELDASAEVQEECKPNSISR